MVVAGKVQGRPWLPPLWLAVVASLLAGCKATGTETLESSPNSTFDRPCAPLDAEACAARSDCVFDRTCHVAGSVCDHLTPLVAREPGADRLHLDYTLGDPCGARDRRCAYHRASDSCVPFVAATCDPVPETVFCDHEDQPLIMCRGEVSCRCVSPSGCGGTQPPADPYGTPSVWTCSPDPRGNGCPVFEPEDGTTCADVAVSCFYGCTAVLDCVDGTWRRSEHYEP